MKKIDLSQSLQLLGNAGVIASIVFLAFELRQNTEAIQQDSAQFMASEQASFNYLWTNPDLARIWVKDLAEGYYSLSPQEQRQMYGIVTGYLQLAQSYFYQWKSGSLDQAIWNGRHQQLVNAFQSDMFRAAWETWGRGASDDFRQYIEQVVLPEGDHPSRE